MAFQKSYWLNVTEAIDVVNLKPDLRLAIRESQVQDGFLIVTVPDGLGALLVAPVGLEKDRELLRWLKEWQLQKVEPPKRAYLSYLFGASLALPLTKGEMSIDLNASVYLLDFTEVEKRRGWQITIFPEPTKPKEGRAR